jgi:alcohol dehydrogenase YqhD (iron-dependent ADH family)
VLNFELFNPTKLVYGEHTEANVGDYLIGICHKVLIHYGSDRIVKSGLLDLVTQSLKKNKIEFVILGGVVPNPLLELAQEGIKIAKAEKIDGIIAIGGGSVLDSAKAIGVGYYYDGDVWDFYTRKAVPTKCLYLATILTIPAEGSEMSNSSVITNPLTNQKFGINSDLIRPNISFVDPLFFTTLPYVQFQAGVADMLCHIYERFFSPTDNVELTSRLALATIFTIVNNAKKVAINYNDIDAWNEIGFGSSIAHNGLLGVGRVQDWGCHRISHGLTVQYGLTHGIALSVLVYNWLKLGLDRETKLYGIKASTIKAAKFHSLLRFLNDNNPEVKDKQNLLSFFEDYYTALKLPKTLSELGITDKSKFSLVIDHALGDNPNGYVGNILKLYSKDIQELLERSF